ncbi:MAG: outer membrane protein assembly factor BamD [Deltaproteobacteria bacterium]|nr:outer membrane protein assembly factor BamD [Deltaproteobacteria bacterium]MBW2296308.1 outer membrane protein assembly factor BamD [Deltaproteobacteria bacterium]MBW2611076.1 outer membrane protein assembly factor BamD [Deltaproteobacteria bacterium]MBW2675938.1 outer membrane protein assembly factor BamD [Deltaproteobacteria bacterium]
MNKLPIIILFLAALSLAGCAPRDPDIEKPAHELAANGTEAFKERDYKDAVKYFEKLRDWYPFSKYAKLAELKIADAHYHLGEYEEAVMAYEEFVELHPKNEAIPYVIYQIGLCHYEQLDTVDRDQTSAKRAIGAFNRLMKNYPQDPHANKAQELYRLCLKSMAEHDLYVGLFYYKTKHYEAALYRFQAVVRQYPDVGAHQTALRYIAACETIIAELDAPPKKK